MPARKRNDLPRPFLKWAGGKTQLLSQFEALYPPKSQVKRYLEPFVGSGAVFFHVKRLFNPDEIFLLDNNEELINVYGVVQNHVEGLIRALAKHQNSHTRDHYYRTRSQNSPAMSSLSRAARLIYLNKTCFNGLYRVNAAGQFNVPMGRYKNPTILDGANLRAAAKALRGVQLQAAHFRDTLEHARSGDFIYFDPPYQPLSQTSSFTAYTRGAFRSSDQEELAEVFRILSARGCNVMLSNSASSSIRKLYDGFEIRRVKARRSINSKAERRGQIPEAVILNYEPSSCGTSMSALPADKTGPVRPSSVTSDRTPRRFCDLPSRE